MSKPAVPDAVVIDGEETKPPVSGGGTEGKTDMTTTSLAR